MASVENVDLVLGSSLHVDLSILLLELPNGMMSGPKWNFPR